jgi:PAS domain S-box-containing protein
MDGSGLREPRDRAVKSRENPAEWCRHLEERLHILSDTMQAFTEATSDSQSLPDVVARRVAEIFDGACAVLLLSDNGQLVTAEAVFAADPELLRQGREALAGPLLVDALAAERHTPGSGHPVFAPTLDLDAINPFGADSVFSEVLRRFGAHSLLILPLRAHDRGLGELVVARCRANSTAFDESDLDLARNLAGQAALALSSSRLQAEARRETIERERIADRLRLLAKASHEFAEVTFDHDSLFDLIARRLGELVGDMCVIRAITEDGEWLESTGAAYHRDPELLALTREVMLAGRQRVGEGISGRAAVTGEPVLTLHLTPAAFLGASERKYSPFLERLGASSSMTLPLKCRGKVVGIANLMRCGPGRPYDDADFRFGQSMAEHAALAIANAQSYANERAARDAAESTANALRRAETRLARLSDSGIIGIIVSDLEGCVSEVNDTLLDLLGYARSEIVTGLPSWTTLTAPGSVGVDARAIEQLTTTGVCGLRERNYRHKNGRLVPVLIGTAMLDGEDVTQEKMCISFVIDLTERREAEAAVERLQEAREADAKFRALLDAAPDAMVIVGADGVIVLVNNQMEAVFGYARTELIGQPIEILIPSKSRERHPAHRETYFGEPGVRPMGAGLELSGRRKDGTEFPIEVSLSPLETADGILVSGAIRDITERQRTEQQRARLAAIVDFSDDAIIGKTLDGVITSWNGGAERMFGYTANEIVGTSISRLVPPGREEEERTILDSLAHGEGQQFDTVRRRQDGRDVDVSVTISPVRDSAGNVVGISKVARDITHRRQAEEALARAKSAAEAASSELEAFSYSVAHDLRAPLRGMSGFARILLDDYADKLDADGQDCLQEIQSNAQKMGALIDGLLSLSRVTRSDWRPTRIDLSALVRAIAATCAADAPGREVSLVVEDHLSAEMDPQLAHALFDNLIGNAWKFTAKVPAARIEFGAIEKDGALTLFLRDNGAGFDVAHAHKLFAPFQRLHTLAEFPGTGIGLATVQRIVHRHGGRIWAEGKVGQGAVFFFVLPGATRGRP